MNKRILNAVRYHILVPLTKLINSCIGCAIFPDVLKLSKVIPLPKKGPLNKPENYRPISILPIFSKIFELVLKKQLVAYLEGHDILSTDQFGFRAGGSTTSAVSKLVGMVNAGYDSKQFISAEFLDLTKAFDCVSHDILLQKLGNCGLDSSSVSLLKSYLSNRFQYVVSKNQVSEPKHVSVGVPQGSILGPLLFLVYMNDLPDCSRDGSFILFADDTTIVHSDSDADSLEIRVRDTLSNVEGWFVSNRLTVNQGKSEKLLFALRTVGDQDVNFVKFLGVYLDNKLTWEKHTQYLSDRLSKNLYLLHKLSREVSFRTLLTAYYGLFHSIISYAVLVWGHSPHASEIFGLQRKAIRIMCNLPYRADCRQAFKSTSVLTLPSMYILQCLLYARGRVSGYTRHGMLHSYDTRGRDDIVPDFHRLSKTRNGTDYYAVKFYNILPRSLRELEMKPFKSALTSFLKDNPFYNFDEFYSADFGQFN